MQKVTMGFYREERVPSHSLFDLAYSCVDRYVGWMRVPFSCFWTDSKYWKGPVSSSFAPLPCTVYLVIKDISSCPHNVDYNFASAY